MVTLRESRDHRTGPNITQSDLTGRRSGSRNPAFTLLPSSNLLQRLCMGLPMSQSQPEARSTLPASRGREQNREGWRVPLEQQTAPVQTLGIQKSLRKMPRSPSGRDSQVLMQGARWYYTNPPTLSMISKHFQQNGAGGRVL